MSEFNLDRARIRDLRWRILKVLDAGRPQRVGERLILSVLCDADLQVTPRELRRELDYLRDHQLVELEGERSPDWKAALTGQGVDVVGYDAEAPAGVARPEQW